MVKKYQVVVAVLITILFVFIYTPVSPAQSTISHVDAYLATVNKNESTHNHLNIKTPCFKILLRSKVLN